MKLPVPIRWWHYLMPWVLERLVRDLEQFHAAEMYRAARQAKDDKVVALEKLAAYLNSEGEKNLKQERTRHGVELEKTRAAVDEFLRALASVNMQRGGASAGAHAGDSVLIVRIAKELLEDAKRGGLDAAFLAERMAAHVRSAVCDAVKPTVSDKTDRRG